jgi:hypothetical protein
VAQGFAQKDVSGVHGLTATSKPSHTRGEGAYEHAVIVTPPSGHPDPPQPVQILYTVVGAGRRIRHRQARHAEQLNLTSPANLAGWALSIMATSDIAPQIRAAPFPRIHV